MKCFVRMTKLTNVSGRAKYISSTEKQEKLVMKSEDVDWKPYQEYERTHQQTHQKNNEGRELIISIPNDWIKLPEQELRDRVQHLVWEAVGKKTDLQWALHWNDKETNLHVHVVFSERQKEKEPGRWDRDVYLTEDGKVARRKADRAKNPDGSDKPPIYRRGELKSPFTAKNPKYKKKGWLHETKQLLQREMERMGAVFDKPGILHEYHEGKGSEAAAIQKRNILIRGNNVLLESYRRKYQLPEDDLRKMGLKAVQQGKLLLISPVDLEKRHFKSAMLTPAELRAAQQATKEKAAAAPEPRPQPSAQRQMSMADAKKEIAARRAEKQEAENPNRAKRRNPDRER